MIRNASLVKLLELFLERKLRLILNERKVLGPVGNWLDKLNESGKIEANLYAQVQRQGWYEFGKMPPFTREEIEKWPREREQGLTRFRKPEPFDPVEEARRISGVGYHQVKKLQETNFPYLQRAHPDGSCGYRSLMLGYFAAIMQFPKEQKDLYLNYFGELMHWAGIENAHEIANTLKDWNSGNLLANLHQYDDFFVDAFRSISDKMAEHAVKCHTDFKEMQVFLQEYDPSATSKDLFRKNILGRDEEIMRSSSYASSAELAVLSGALRMHLSIAPLDSQSDKGEEVAKGVMANLGEYGLSALEGNAPCIYILQRDGHFDALFNKDPELG